MKAFNLVVGAVAAVVLATSGCDPFAEHGNGNIVSEERAVQGFTRVKNMSQVDVVIREGDAFRTTVTLDSNLLGNVITTVNGDTLEIDVEPAIFVFNREPIVEITMPRFDGAITDGSGDISISEIREARFQELKSTGSGDIRYCGPASGLDLQLTASGDMTLCDASSVRMDHVEVEVSGSGSLNLAGVSSEVIAVRQSGSGDVRLAGAANRLESRIDGSGSLRARGLSAKDAALNMRASGEAEVTVTGVLDASLSGSGDLTVYGGAMIRNFSQTGSGELRRAN